MLGLASEDTGAVCAHAAFRNLLHKVIVKLSKIGVISLVLCFHYGGGGHTKRNNFWSNKMEKHVRESLLLAHPVYKRKHPHMHTQRNAPHWSHSTLTPQLIQGFTSTHTRFP